MHHSGVLRPRYQGLAAARRLRHEPTRPKERFSLRVGDRIGDLTVIGHLACGRITELYQVWSNEHWCALTAKVVMAQHHVAGKPPPSFSREERVLRTLRHPNVVQYFGSGGTAEQSYLLLEYLAGPSLFELLQMLPKRRLHVPDALRAAMHVGAAVHYLHRRGYLYRDLKPANILLREGILVVLDFDVVRKLDSPHAPADRLGTAPYMAPEQVRCELLTAATDVYGLGALLYEMLTGRWPTEEPEERDWDEDWLELTTEAGTDADTAEPLNTEQLEARYPQLSREAIPPREHAPNIGAALEQIVLRALAHDPAARFQTVSGMLAALAPHLKGRYRLWPEAAPIERRVDTASR